MHRLTPFDRDFADLHGREPRPSEFIRHEDVRRGRIVSRVDHPGLRLMFGAVGLFWAIVLGVLLIAMIVVAWAMISGALHPAALGPQP